jgi:hypothetical protein
MSDTEWGEELPDRFIIEWKRDGDALCSATSESDLQRQGSVRITVTSALHSFPPSADFQRDCQSRDRSFGLLCKPLPVGFFSD